MSPGRNDLQTDRLALLPAVVSAGAAFSADVLGAAVPLSTAPGCIRLRSVLGVDPELVESTARAVALGNTACPRDAPQQTPISSFCVLALRA